VRGAAGLERGAALGRAAAAGFAAVLARAGDAGLLALLAPFAAAFDARVLVVVFGAGASVAAAAGVRAGGRREPMRSGRVVGSPASTPLSSFLAFGFCFLGLSTLSAIASRVYGSRSGRGERPPSNQAPS
jgi:hypothetical protein